MQTVYLNSKDLLLRLIYVFVSLQLLIKGDEYQHLALPLFLVLENMS